MAQSQSASPRSRFWLGVVLAFALLTLASCGALFATTGLSQVSLAELQGGGPAWTPPPVTPTPESVGLVNASEAGGSVAGLFQPGQTVRNVTNGPVNLRATAGYLAKPADDVLGRLAPGTSVEILGPAAPADGLTWWLVRLRNAGGSTLEGWVAEATASGVTILGE